MNAQFSDSKPKRKMPKYFWIALVALVILLLAGVGGLILVLTQKPAATADLNVPTRRPATLPAALPTVIALPTVAAASPTFDTTPVSVTVVATAPPFVTSTSTLLPTSLRTATPEPPRFYAYKIGEEGTPFPQGVRKGQKFGVAFYANGFMPDQKITVDYHVIDPRGSELKFEQNKSAIAQTLGDRTYANFPNTSFTVPGDYAFDSIVIQVRFSNQWVTVLQVPVVEPTSTPTRTLVPSRTPTPTRTPRP